MKRDTSIIIYIICGSSRQLKRISNYKLEKGSSLIFLDFDEEDLTEKIANLKNSFFCLVPAGFFPNKRARDFMAKVARNNMRVWGKFSLNLQIKDLVFKRGLAQNRAIFFHKDIFFSVGGHGKNGFNLFHELEKRFSIRMDSLENTGNLIRKFKNNL
tara:strand:+ start:65 stop:535 length:471 start_codon:yes stop_codon:yes gene_type:complete